jgi:hypothetical protein
VTPPVRTGAEPLVAVVCEVPLLAEALAASLVGIAEVRAFPADVEDLEGLLRSLDPDAVVVDRADSVEAAERFARESDVPLVHVLIRKGEVHMLRAGAWEFHDGDEGTSPEAIRNALVAGMFGRQRA